MFLQQKMQQEAWSKEQLSRTGYILAGQAQLVDHSRYYFKIVDVAVATSWLLRVFWTD